MTIQTIYGPFKQLLTLESLPMHGPLKDDELDVQHDMGVLVEGGKIEEVGNFEHLSEKYPNADRAFIDAQDLVALPAFVDCHTHICWGGTRVNDYAMRVAGKTYLEIAKAGGGIMDTVTATREASVETLVDGILQRVKQHIKRGITTIEVKSGYGLTLKDEIKMLQCIKAANEHTPATLIPTFLGAHIKPKDFNGSHKEYLDHMISEVVPVIQKKELATRADIFVEEGAFGIDESRAYAERLQQLGFDMTMHVDQFHPGGSVMSNEIGCVSADHLECTDDKSVEAFSGSETVAVALPGASLGLGMQFTPARKLLDHNACLAIATDWNPGSGPMGDLITQASILGAREKLSIAETLAGTTYRSAHALREKAGTITKGEKAQMVIFETDDFRNIFYQQGQLMPSFTVIGEDCISNV
jgi:imidazolonepropionase